MATHQMHVERDTVYFITFTCLNWLNLFEVTNTYAAFDKWFAYLSAQKADLLGYVIMPNHFHGLIHIQEECQLSLNKMVANGKRFLAYEIVRKLEEQANHKLLKSLAFKRSESEKRKGSKHKVYIPSFDAKVCYDRIMVETKLDYIHHNPVLGKWSLVEEWPDYPFSSAAFYMKEEEHEYVRHYLDFT